jgi:hypothetical protein
MTRLRLPLSMMPPDGTPEQITVRSNRGARRVSGARLALGQAASSLLRSQSYLGAQYRRLRAKLGAPKAIKAMANRLSRIIYRMCKFGQAYVDKGDQYSHDKFRSQQLAFLNKKAASFGLRVILA